MSEVGGASDYVKCITCFIEVYKDTCLQYIKDSFNMYIYSHTHVYI